MGTAKVEDSIRMGGLAEIKTERVKAILSTLREERGKISLEYIRDMEDEDIKKELTRSALTKPRSCQPDMCPLCPFLY